MVLKEFTIQAISKGSDDMGKVHMQVEYDGQMYYGFGANTHYLIRFGMPMWYKRLRTDLLSFI